MSVLDSLKAEASKVAAAIKAEEEKAAAAVAAKPTTTTSVALDGARDTLKGILGGPAAQGIVNAVEQLVGAFIQNEVNSFVASHVPAGFEGVVEDVVDGILNKAGAAITASLSAEQKTLAPAAA